MIILIHNFRTEIVGSNQIKTVFDPEYKWYINLEGYDRISQYYLRPEDFKLGVDEDDNNFNEYTIKTDGFVLIPLLY